MRIFIAILILSGFAVAGIHSDNVYRLGHIQDACNKIDRYSHAYFGGVEVDGFTLPLTPVQKDSLIARANRQIERIKAYADSLELYPE